MKRNDNAVSPVVGVMLMLVVTIIIAAVVSGFAGTLTGGETSKIPQAQIQADYSQSNGMTIRHMGGDTINTLQTKIFVRPTRDFGGYDQMNWEVNLTAAVISKGRPNKGPWAGKDEWPWLVPGDYTSRSARTFQPGETAVVEHKTLGQVQPATYTTDEDDSGGSNYGFQHPNNIGQRFILSIVDDAGRTITQTEVTIRA
jgi:FlaG/FlaF family flagellin (archaellin)